MERRDLFRIIAATAATASTGIAQHASHTPSKSVDDNYQPRFFSEAEFKTVKSLCRAILPADDEGGGALEAGAPKYIDTFAVHGDNALQTLFRSGLAAVNRTARSQFGGDISTLKPDQQDEVVNAFAKNEKSPLTEEDRFFVRFKLMVIDAYFQSPVGMKYVGYKGNTGVYTFPGCTHQHSD